MQIHQDIVNFEEGAGRRCQPAYTIHELLESFYNLNTSLNCDPYGCAVMTLLLELIGARSGSFAALL